MVQPPSEIPDRGAPPGRTVEVYECARQVRIIEEVRTGRRHRPRVFPIVVGPRCRVHCEMGVSASPPAGYVPIQQRKSVPGSRLVREPGTVHILHIPVHPVGEVLEHLRQSELVVESHDVKGPFARGPEDARTVRRIGMRTGLKMTIRTRGATVGRPANAKSENQGATPRRRITKTTRPAVDLAPVAPQRRSGIYELEPFGELGAAPNWIAAASHGRPAGNP